VALSRGGSPIEAALADALVTRYASTDPDASNRAYREAMRQMYVRFPDDPDVATIYADAIMNLRQDPWGRDVHRFPRSGAQRGQRNGLGR
jgi:hypothetical protein